MRSGHAFELEVRDLIQRELNCGTFGILGDSAKVFTGKAYYSIDRRRPLIVDVSIELYRKGATEAYLRWVWECKDTARLVAVDEIEEFHAKLEQIGLHKTKGTVACRSGFQRAAMLYAQAKGIGLVLVTPAAALKTVLEYPWSVRRELVESLIVEPAAADLNFQVCGISTTLRPAISLRDLVVLELGLGDPGSLHE